MNIEDYDDDEAITKVDLSEKYVKEHLECITYQNYILVLLMSLLKNVVTF